MKHVGDITKLSGYDLPLVDVITGGSPCQDLSVAGKRAGLAGERSGLFMEQVRIIKEMRSRNVQTAGGADKPVRYPRYAIWENVPGALSSPGKDNPGADFAAVIEEFVKVCEPGADVDVRVPDGGWPKAGCYFAEDGSWSLAWRVHDAQFFGVPQRRRRVSLLVDFDGDTAPWILFDPERERETEEGYPVSLVADTGAESAGAVQPLAEGVCGHPDQSGEAWQGVAEGAEGSLGEPGAYTLKIRGGVERDSSGKKAGKGALIQTELSATLGVNQDQTLIQPCLNPWDVQSKHIQSPDGIAEALYSGECRYGGGESYVLPINTMVGTRTTDEKRTTMGIGGDGDPQFSISAAHEHGVFVAGFKGGQSDGGIGYEEEKSPTLTSPPPGIEPTVLAVDVYNQSVDGEVAAALTAAAGGTNTRGPKVLSAGFKPRQGAAARDIGYEREKSPTVLTDLNAAALVESYQDVTGPLMASGYDKLGTQEAMNGMYVVPKEPTMIEMTSTKNTVVEDGVSPTLTARMGTGGNQVNAVLDKEPIVLESNQNHATVTDDGVCNTLPASMGMGGGYTPMVLPFDTTQVTHPANYSHPRYGDPCHPLAAGAHPPAVAFTQNQREEVRELGEVAGGLAAEGGSHQQTYVRSYGIDQQGGKGGANYAKDVCPPILSDSHGTPHAVAYGISAFDSNAMKSGNPYSGIYEAYTSRTLDLNGGSPACNQGGIAIVEPIPIEGNGTRESHRGDGYGKSGEPMFTLNTTEQHKVMAEKPVECLGVGFFQNTVDQAPSLLARDYKDPSIINRSSVVRRLTPTECERLQGFPDGWTDLGEWTDSQGKKHKDADSPRYKALGNSIALPFWTWLAGRICAQYDRPVAIGSLFDGISGFCVAFSVHGGIPVWSSEIEEFAVAVAKKHFGDDDTGLAGDFA